MGQTISPGAIQLDGHTTPLIGDDANRPGPNWIAVGLNAHETGSRGHILQHERC